MILLVVLFVLSSVYFWWNGGEVLKTETDSRNADHVTISGKPPFHETFDWKQEPNEYQIKLSCLVIFISYNNCTLDHGYPVVSIQAILPPVTIVPFTA